MAAIDAERGIDRLPCVGVLCIDIAQKLREKYLEADFKSYIAASYVKYLEGAGARVVPIWIGCDQSYYENIMSQINGILIPGGAVFFDSQEPESTFPNDCVQSSGIIFEIAKRKNDIGEYFPMWGTCLGMQLLVLHSAKSEKVRGSCKHMDNVLPLTLTEDFRDSKLFKGLSNHLEQLMRAPVGYHYHRYCITRDSLKQHGIANAWHVLATNTDHNGLEFVSVLEHVRYPFYGVQIHPERACFEYMQQRAECSTVRLSQCIEVAHYLASFFVAECRRSKNSFPTRDEELRHLIENFEVTLTGKWCCQWLQCYLFKDCPDYPQYQK